MKKNYLNPMYHDTGPFDESVHFINVRREHLQQCAECRQRMDGAVTRINDYFRQANRGDRDE